MNVLVLNSRGLHLGYLGCYGCEWVPTPHIDRLASEGIVFDQHLADCPKLTFPGESIHRSAWTSRFGPPLVADARPENLLAQLLESREIAARFLVFEDWQRVLAGSWIEQLATCERGLFWLDLPGLAPPWRVADEYLAPFFGNASGEGDDEPLTAWADPSAGPIDPDSPDLERARSTYAAVIAQFDMAAGEIIGAVRDRGLLNRTLLVLTADCGLALGEHGVLGEHRAWLHEEVVHLPLIVRLPEGAEAGRRVAALTQPIDLFPSLLEAFDLPAPVNHGHSLWPLLRGQQEQVRPYACAGLQIGDSIEGMLRTPDFAFLLPLQTPATDPARAPQLYLKPDDRWEVNDVGQHHLDLAEHMERTLRDFAASARHPGPLQPPDLIEATEGEPPDADAV